MLSRLRYRPVRLAFANADTETAFCTAYELGGGQANGTIVKQGGKRSKDIQDVAAPTDFATKPELSGGNGGRGIGIYDLTDNVTDEQFEDIQLTGSCYDSVPLTCMFL